MSRWICGVLVMLLAACGDDDLEQDDGGLDAVVELDGGRDSRMDVSTDAAPIDASSDAMSDAQMGTTALVAEFPAGRATLTRAYYGITLGPQPEIYLEAYLGGDDGCPSMDSPAPDYSLLINGIKTMHGADISQGLSATLFDFKGDLTSSPFISSQVVQVRSATSMTCVECVGQSMNDDGFVRLEVDIRFENGTVTGPLFATHCDSLDQVEPDAD